MRRRAPTLTLPRSASLRKGGDASSSDALFSSDAFLFAPLLLRFATLGRVIQARRFLPYTSRGDAITRDSSDAPLLPPPEETRDSSDAPLFLHLPCAAGEVAREGARVGARRDVSTCRTLVMARGGSITRPVAADAPTCRHPE